MIQTLWEDFSPEEVSQAFIEFPNKIISKKEWRIQRDGFDLKHSSALESFPL